MKNSNLKERLASTVLLITILFQLFRFPILRVQALEHENSEKKVKSDAKTTVIKDESGGKEEKDDDDDNLFDLIDSMYEEKGAQLIYGIFKYVFAYNIICSSYYIISYINYFGYQSY